MHFKQRAATSTALALLACGPAAAEVVGHPDPLSLLSSEDPALAANKRLVFDLWRGIVNAGHVELADELLAENYIQHSPVLPTGRAAFKQIFSAVPRRETIPETVEPPLVALVAEGPYVVMALAETLAEPGGTGSYTSTHFNLFRVEQGRLAEHWHSVQTPPGPNVAPPEAGGPQPVTGEENGDQYPLLTAASWQLAVNKRLVFDVSRQLFDAGREQLAALYLTESFQSHSPLVAPGREGMLTELATRADRPIGTAIGSPLVAMFAEGDLVVQVTMHEHLHPSRSEARYTTTGFEMFRVSEGRLAEHWNAAGKPVDSECAADALRYVCGLRNAEDIVRVGTSRWLIASSITTRGEAVGAGRLYLIDAATGTAEELFPGADASLRPDAGLFGNCATIDLGAFDTHGLALRETAPDRYRLYVTSHGAVEAIQAFDVDASGARPAVAWIGCVPLPAKVWANSVAILADGGFVTSQFMDPTDPDSVPALLRGEPNGAAYEWHPGGAVAPIAGTELAGPNGIALSADERFLFVAAFGGRRVLRFDRGPEPGPPVVLEVDFVPDNLRWSERGTLLAAGSNPAGAGGWTIFEIDPDAMTGVALATIGPGAALQGASTAVQVGGQLWVGTPGGDRVGYLDLR